MGKRLVLLAHKPAVNRVAILYDTGWEISPPDAELEKKLTALMQSPLPDGYHPNLYAAKAAQIAAEMDNVQVLEVVMPTVTAEIGKRRTVY